MAGTFQGMSQANVSAFFDNYTGVPNSVTIGSWVFCLIFNLYFLSRGVGEGIEKVARVGMPLLLLFGFILAIQGISIQAGHQGAVADGTMGLNFLWTPDFTTIWSPKVWLAAAGQVFFTLSVGVGAIQCYASYIAENEDIALNAMSAGWMNEFVEVVVGAAIVIPISVGYLGLENVVNIVNGGGSGFSLGFRTMPYLFQQWGTYMSAFANFMWFGILFFAGVTSSLAMGLPFMGLMKDNFKWSTATTTIVFGLMIFALGFLPVFYFNEGAMGEYDYWAGAVSLVIFACLEIILFAWVFGMKRGWEEINNGADIKIPLIFKYIIQYVTPLFLIAILLGNIEGWFASLTDPKITVIQWVARGIMLFVFALMLLMIRLANKRKAVL
jgi:neurotransmitter:Na+ symporter, NSS family